MPVRRRVMKKKPAKRNYRRGGSSPYALNKVYKFKRLAKSVAVYNTTTLGQLATNDVTMVNIPAVGTAEAGGVGYQFGASLQFRASNVQTFGDFSALYDQYKITGVGVKLIPLSDSANAQNSGFLPTMYYARDMDDSLLPAVEADLRERQDVKTVRLTKPVNIFIKNPKVQADVNLSTGLASPAMVTTGWINCTDTTVQHNGLKMWFKNVDLRAQPTTITAYRIECTYYLSFRNPQ